MWGELSSEWGELSSECGASCLGASCLGARNLWGELSIIPQFQYSDRLIENSDPQKIRFSEVLLGALLVLSW